tara:strand:+ start:8318 stop:8740 length:423 start_codon:yes stop_codon:yes gene_type:complete
MKILIKVIYIIILFILFSCDEEGRKISLDETFVLQYGETKILDGQDHFSISFIDLLEDSRCPANAICVWEGQARVKIEINENFEILTKELTTGTLKENQANKINIGHYTIELLKVIPYPEKAENQIDKSDYSVQLVITSN